MVLCQKKNELMVKYSVAAVAYADAVSVWVAKSNAGGGEEVQCLKILAREARYTAEDARHELEVHTFHHGC